MHTVSQIIISTLLALLFPALTAAQDVESSLSVLRELCIGSEARYCRPMGEDVGQCIHRQVTSIDLTASGLIIQGIHIQIFFGSELAQELNRDVLIQLRAAQFETNANVGVEMTCSVGNRPCVEVLDQQAIGRTFSGQSAIFMCSDPEAALTHITNIVSQLRSFE